MPAEMRAMFRGLTLPVGRDPIHRVAIPVDTTEDRITETLEQFAVEHPLVRLGSYPDLAADPPQVTLVLVSRSASGLHEAEGWVRSRLRCL